MHGLPLLLRKDCLVRAEQCLAAENRILSFLKERVQDMSSLAIKNVPPGDERDI